VDDIRQRSPALREHLDVLSRRVDRIYVHVDMDVLDPAEVPGHDLAVPNGPTSRELADALAVMFQHPNVVALGIASTPAGSLDPDQYSRKAALTLIRGAMDGVRAR
jgi:arginase family enzyme